MSLRQPIAAAVNGVLHRAGLRLTREANLPTMGLFFERLLHYGLAPREIFDVGVATGTEEIYGAFPRAKYSLFDPTKESLPHMQAIAARLNARIFNVALGDEAGQAEIAVRADDLGSTSLFAYVDDVPIAARYAVRVQRFDDLVTTVDRPSLCKIDVQGAELGVLRGMTMIIDQIDFFIIEVCLLNDETKDSKIGSFSSVHQFMEDRGFCLYDVAGLLRRPLDGALGQMDAVYVKRTSPLRADRRWHGNAVAH